MHLLIEMHPALVHAAQASQSVRFTDMSEHNIFQFSLRDIMRILRIPVVFRALPIPNLGKNDLFIRFTDRNDQHRNDRLGKIHGPGYFVRAEVFDHDAAKPCLGRGQKHRLGYDYNVSGLHPTLYSDRSQ